MGSQYASKGGPLSIPPLTGVLPVLQMPFHPDESIDHDALRAEARWCLNFDIRGLVVGMVSEVVRLDEVERAAVIRTLAPIARDAGVALVASVGAESTKTARRRAWDAVQAGATALMVTAPMVLATDELALRDYFLSIASECELPIVIQDASGYVGRPLSIQFQIEMLEALGPMGWLKPEAPPFGQRVSQLRKGSGGRARILEGSGGIALVDSYRRGIVGTMPAADVCWAVASLWQALESGDADRISRIHGPLAALISLQTSLDAFIAIEKHLLFRQGVIPTTVMRQPVSYLLDPETEIEADRLADLLADACREESLTPTTERAEAATSSSRDGQS
jgi:dihydrodipicolinate synthase/N-acetylneuraminate lyase